MRRVIVIVTVLAIALFAASGNPAFATGSASLYFSPPSKYTVLNLSSYAETNVDQNLAVGDTTARAQRAQGFKIPVSRTVGRVNLWLKKSGAPADNLRVEIQTNSGVVPSGTPVTNGVSNTVAGSSLGTSYGWVAFDFSTPPLLTAGTPYTQYHLVLKRTGSVPSADYYVWGADQPSPGYTDGAGSVYNVSAWQATSPATDHAFQVKLAFTVDVYVKDVLNTTKPCAPPIYTQACGLGGYQLKVHFDQSALQYVSTAPGPFLTSTGRTPICWNAFGHDPLNGVVAYLCTTEGNPGLPTPFGPEGSGVLATLTFVPLAPGTTSLQFLTGTNETVLSDVGATEITYTAENGSVTVTDFVGVAGTDTDGDGCTDLEELGDNPALGGDRNPSFAWDFYDVPVPANHDSTPNGPRDKAVGLSDVLAVLYYVGARENYPPNPNGVDYDSLKDGDWNGDTVVNALDKVGRQYDRSPSWPFNGAPDGAVTMGDVLAALPQVGHSCTAPP